MMKIPDPKPTERQLRQIAEVGKAVEESVVRRWHEAGMLLTNPPWEKVQTKFTRPDLWLTGSVDAVIRPPGWNRGHVVEVKSKDHEVIAAMKANERVYDPEHRRQCLTYIWLANEASLFLWPELDPVDTGSIFYMSRQRPAYTHEFFFRLNEEAAELGAAKLKEWQEAFLNDQLPERDGSWRWTETPCKYCKFKNVTLPDGTKLGCKQDDKDNVTTLSESSLMKLASHVNPRYSAEEVREAVLRRWARA